jgi:outer membrane receptor protein involved in Fe transport
MLNRLSAVVIAALLAVTSVASAQETTGTLAGRITDAQGLAVPGATVTVTGAQGSRSTVSDGDGRFSMPFLPPGAYDVRAELQGFKVVDVKAVAVALGQTQTMAIKMEVGGLTETVEVTGSTTVVDTQSTTIGATMTDELLKNVPIGRRFADTIYMAPGVSSGGGTGQMSAGASIGGGSGLENQYVVDGVNITNTGYGSLGSYSIVFGSLGNGVTFDFMKEVQVKTGGYEAEYGQSTGGVVNVVTKSGSNVLRGSAFAFTRPDWLEGGYEEVQTDNGTINTTAQDQSDFGIEAGGPIVRDKLFFFGAINPQWETRTLVAPEGFPLESLGEVDRNRQVTSYAAKGTYQIASSHRIDASFFGDPATGEMGPQRFSSLLRTDTAAFSEIKYGGHNQIVKYDGVMSPNWLLEASFARAYNNLEETPSANEWNVRDTTVVPNIRTGGIGFYEVGNTGTNKQWQAKSTHILGDHQIKAGLLYEDITYDNINQRTGPTIRLADGSQTVTGAEVDIIADPTFGRIYRVTRANTDNVRQTEQQYTSFFAQDTWAVNDRLTVRPGIRYEQQKLTGNLADFTWDGNWAGRIGATYDVLGNGRSKLYGSWGRYFAKIPNDLAARALSADAGVTRADYFDAGLTQPIPNGVLAGAQTQHLVQAGLSPAEIDPTSKSTYQDEAIVGYEWEAFPGINIGARYIHRSMPRILEDVGTAAFVLYDLGVEGLDSVEYFITNPRDGYPATVDNVGAFEDPIHDYDAVEILVDKRFANNWQLSSSYRWSRLHGNFEGFFRNDNGQSDPAITSLYDFPTNDPSYTEIGVPQFHYSGDVRFLGALGAGPLPNDRPHQIKVFGNRVWNNFNLGAGLVLSSGKPLTPFAANPNYQSDGEIPEAPRGSGIDTVDGFNERTPFETEVNLHADYALRFGTRRVTLIADVFNLFNNRDPRDYDQNTEISPTVLNPDFGQPSRDNVAVFANPFALRLGVRFEF